MEAFQIKTKDGLVINTPKNLNVITPYVLFEQFNWYESEIEFMKSYLQDDMNMLDVGAGFGVYALEAAFKVGKTGKVFAFEPTLETRRFLWMNQKANGLESLEISGTAISNTNGVGLLSSQSSPELNRLAKAGEEVTTITLDNWWLATQKPAIHFVKIDVNGDELTVLQGAWEMFEQNNPVVLVTINKENATGVTSWLKEQNYRLFSYIRSSATLLNFDLPEAGLFRPENLIALRGNTLAELSNRGWIFNEHTEPVQAENESWTRLFEDFEWAKPMMFGWENVSENPDYQHYFDALNKLCLAESIRVNDEADVNIRSRKTLLLYEAANSMIDLYQAMPGNTSVALSLIRTLNALGKKNEAISIMQSVIETTSFGQKNIDVSLPFMLPIENHDSTKIRTDFSKWLMVRIIESWILLKDESTFYSGEQELQLLNVLRGNPEISSRVQNVHKIQDIKGALKAADSNSKSLMFITTDFPPYDEGRIGHSIRAYTLANFLAKNGYKVYLLVLQNMVADREAPYMHKNITIINPFFYEMQQSKPDVGVPEFCLSFLKKQGITNILTSSPPIISHMIALELKAILGNNLNWIADFRDFIHIHPRTRSNSIDGLRSQKQYECSIMQKADSVVMVSTGMVKIADDMFTELEEEFDASKVQIVENGYIEQDETPAQPEVIEFIKEARDAGKIVLYYAGTGTIAGVQRHDKLYKDLTFLFDLMQKHPEMASKYALVIQGKVQINTKYLHGLKLKLKYKFFDGVENARLMANLKYADIGLSVNSDEIATPYIMGGKLYDYARAGLALLLVYPKNPDSLLEFAEKHQNKPYFANIFDANSVRSVLQDIAENPAQMALRRFNDEEVQPYSRNALYQTFLQLIDNKKPEKKKFIHFCYNSIYAQTIGDMVEHLSQNTDQLHELYVSGEQVIKGYSANFSSHSYCHFFNHTRELAGIIDLAGDKNVEAIYMHGLFRSWQYDLVNALGDDKHIGWVIWGGDLYNPIKQNWMHKFPAAKISSIHSLSDGDIALFTENYGNREILKFGYPYPGLYGNRVDVTADNPKSRIIVGNSGDSSNHHLEILQILEKKADIQDFEILLPVAYNFEADYEAELNHWIGSSSLKGRVKFQKKFLAPDEYFKLIRNSSLLITAHQRQQAVGNMLMAMYSGINTVLRDVIEVNGKLLPNPSWQFFDDHGLRATSLNKLREVRTVAEIEKPTNELKQRHQMIISQQFGLDKNAKDLMKASNIIATLKPETAPLA